jgi:hypothetical protein
MRERGRSYPRASSDAVNKEYVMNAIYPVGSIYISTLSTNPATLLGFGTWEAFGEGRTLVGLKSTDTDFDTVGETGGVKTVTISQANLPNISTGAGTAHTHTQNAHTHTQDAHGHLFTNGSVPGQSFSESIGTGANWRIIGNTDQYASISNTIATNQNTSATNQNESSHTHSLGGSGTSMSIMNPYIVTYMFKRTA